MLVRFNNDNFEAEGSSALVVAIYEYGNRNEYMCVADVRQTHPHVCEAKDVTVMDAETPSDWKEASHTTGEGDPYALRSFPQWADEPLFLNWLMEDEWQPDKTKEAGAILGARVREYVEMHAAKVAGSAKAAKEALLKSRFERQVRDHAARGFERPTEPDLSNDALRGVKLNVSDLKELYEIHNK